MEAQVSQVYVLRAYDDYDDSWYNYSIHKTYEGATNKQKTLVGHTLVVPFNLED